MNKSQAYLDSMELLGISLNTEQISVEFTEEQTIDVPVEVIETKPSTKLPDAKVVTIKGKLPKVDTSKITSVKPIRSFDLREQIATVGYFDINYGIVVTGKKATDVLLAIWDKYRFLDCQGGYYRQPLRIKFADKKENYLIGRKVKVRKDFNGKELTKEQAKKLDKSQYLTTEETEYQEQLRTVYIPNQQPVTLGLPSEHISGHKSSIKATEVDYSKIIECYLGDTLLYEADKKKSVQNIKVLGSQAINQNSGKERYHKNGGFPAVRKRTSMKMSTKTRITNDMNVWVDTRIRSKLFSIDGSNKEYQIKILETGNIKLLKNNQDVAVVGEVVNYYLSEVITFNKDNEKVTTFKYRFIWSYYQMYDTELQIYKDNIWDKPDVTDAINSVLNGKRSIPSKLLEMYKDTIEYGKRMAAREATIQENKETVKHIPVGKVKRTRSQRRNAAKRKRKELELQSQSSN